MEGEEEIWQCDSTFWFATLQPLVADEATMHYLKGDMFSFNMRHKILICHHRLQSGRPKCWITLSDFLFPFHNLTWGFCFRLHIIPIFCRFEVDGCALPEQARVSTPWFFPVSNVCSQASAVKRSRLIAQLADSDAYGQFLAASHWVLPCNRKMQCM